MYTATANKKLNIIQCITRSFKFLWKHTSLGPVGLWDATATKTRLTLCLWEMLLELFGKHFCSKAFVLDQLACIVSPRQIRLPSKSCKKKKMNKIKCVNVRSSSTADPLECTGQNSSQRRLKPDGSLAERNTRLCNSSDTSDSAGEIQQKSIRI